MKKENAINKMLLRAAGTVGALLFWILLWQVIADRADLELILPKPFSVFSRLLALCAEKSFYHTLLLSFLRIVSGFLLGLFAGTALALLCAKLRFCDALFSPLMTVIRSTPVASFIIVVILWVDKNHVPVLISFLMVLPVIWQNTRLGIASIRKETREVAAVFRIRPMKRFFRIYVPIVGEFVLSASQTALGLAWKAGVAAEVLSLPRVSIGTMIYNAKLYLESVDLYAWTIAIILISILLEKLFAYLFSKVRKHHADA